MISFSNITAANPIDSTTYKTGAAILVGGTTYMIPWIPTARPAIDGQNLVAGYPIEEATRTKTTCFMRGLKERVQVQTNDGTPWQWRRICFTLKGDRFYQFTNTSHNLYQETSNGVVRNLNNVLGGASPNMGNTFLDWMFDGTQSTDWSSYFTAKVDTQRVTLKSDRTRIIQSGNASGVMRNYRAWYPMNKNLVYDDDENGGGEGLGPYSVQSKAGMGDYYIIDIISSGTGGTSSNLLSFDPEATLYWHEK